MGNDRETVLDAALAQIDRAFGKNGDGARTELPPTMTERVARSLCGFDAGSAERKTYIDEHWRDYIDRAQSVFLTMSTPTADMLGEADYASEHDHYLDLETAREQFAHIWDVMLTHAEYELDERELARKAHIAQAQAEFEKMSPEEKAAHWAAWEAEHSIAVNAPA